jgi:tetratricopeptide (TPR) repeat protein
MSASNAEAPQGFEFLLKCLAADPRNVDLACEIIDQYLAQYQYDDAQSLLNQLDSSLLEEPGILFRQARLGLILGDYPIASKNLTQLINNGEDGNVALWHDLGFCQLCMRETQAAKDTVAQAVQRFGESVELDLLSSRIEMIESHFDSALAYADKALINAPEHTTALGLKALALLDMGEPDKAFEVAIACLQLYPDQYEALLVAGTVQLWRKQAEQSANYFMRALERHSGSGRALSGYGQVLMLQQQLQPARAVLQQATAAMPEHLGTWHALAWAELLTGDLASAERSYQSAFEIDRNFAETHGGLALVDAIKGNHVEAEQAVKRALRLNPQCLTALYAQTLLLSDSGMKSESLSQLERLMQTTALPIRDIEQFANNLRKRISGHQ